MYTYTHDVIGCFKEMKAHVVFKINLNINTLLKPLNVKNVPVTFSCQMNVPVTCLRTCYLEKRFCF